MAKKQLYARLDGQLVAEIVSLNTNTKPTDIYVPDLAASFVLAPENINVGWELVDGEWLPPTVTTPLLSEIKTALKNQIDVAAENERLKYITDGVGQAMTYQEKVNQAAEYSKAFTAHLKEPKTIPSPNDAEYPLLSASLGIDGDTLAEVAETVTHAYALWQQIGGAIETIRLQSKAAIDAAETAEAAQVVYDAVTWPSA